jgi:hypothetical protein
MTYQRHVGGLFLFPLCGVWFNLKDIRFFTTYLVTYCYFFWTSSTLTQLPKSLYQLKEQIDVAAKLCHCTHLVICSDPGRNTLLIHAFMAFLNENSMILSWLGKADFFKILHNLSIDLSESGIRQCFKVNHRKVYKFVSAIHDSLCQTSMSLCIWSSSPPSWDWGRAIPYSWTLLSKLNAIIHTYLKNFSLWCMFLPHSRFTFAFPSVG